MSAPPRHVVTAIVVSHNGERWLSELIAGLRQQRRAPDRILAVDTGSDDTSVDLLSRGFSPNAVIREGRELGFGQAVRRAVSALPPAEPGTVEWLWLLHDDCAPTPAALRELLVLLDEVPAAAILGPKLRSWPRGRQLLELGATIGGSGGRETGMEPREFDQGQHDVVRETLTVSTAGMLVRRDVFERLGGFDRRLPLFGDDVDFGWRAHRAGYHVITCPDAIVYHAEAAQRGARRLDAARGARPRQAERRAALYTLLVNCTWLLFPIVALRLIAGSLARTLGLLVAKWPDAAWDEFRALAATLLRPDRVMRGRLRRVGGRKVPRRKYRHLFPPPWASLLKVIDTVTGVVSTRTENAGSHAGSRKRTRTVETGPVAEEAEELEVAGPGRVIRALTRPPVLLIGALALVSAVACRDLLFGGVLAGGALLPAPESAFDLWSRYTESWHPVELGTDRAAPPYLAVLAFLGTIAMGNIDLVVELLLLGAAPLAATTAYLFGRGLLSSRPVRMWAAGAYGMVPVLTGAVADGRLGTCVAAILLPLLAMTAQRMIVGGGWSATWTTALLLAIVSSFVPIALVLAAGLAVVAVLFCAPRARTAGRLATVLMAATGLLLPWLGVLIADPRLLFGEAGRVAPGMSDPDLPGYFAALGDPGGPGAAPFWLIGALVPIALAALLRRDRTLGVGAAWLVACTGVVVAAVQSRVWVNAEWLSGGAPAWPGFAAVLTIGGWIGAIAYASDGVGRLFRARSFTWRQPGAAFLALAALLAPVAAAGWWVLSGTDGLLQRVHPPLPAYLATAQQSIDQPRTLLLRVEEDRARYTVLRTDGARLGDAETGTATARREGLDTAVGDLLGLAEADALSARLSGYGIGYVFLPSADDGDLVQHLDTTPGLERASAPDGAAAWEVKPEPARARILPVGAGRDAAGERLRLDVDGEQLRTRVPEGEAGRTVVLTEAYDDGWRATLDGRVLAPIEHGWAQAFQLPATGGRLLIQHSSVPHTALLTLQGVLLLLVVVLALPTRSREIERPPTYPEAGKHADLGEPMPDPPPVPRSARPAQQMPVVAGNPANAGGFGPMGPTGPTDAPPVHAMPAGSGGPANPGGRPPMQPPPQPPGAAPTKPRRRWR